MCARNQRCSHEPNTQFLDTVHRHAVSSGAFEVFGPQCLALDCFLDASLHFLQLAPGESEKGSESETEISWRTGELCFENLLKDMTSCNTAKLDLQHHLLHSPDLALEHRWRLPRSNCLPLGAKMQSCPFVLSLQIHPTLKTHWDPSSKLQVACVNKNCCRPNE